MEGQGRFVDSMADITCCLCGCSIKDRNYRKLSSLEHVRDVFEELMDLGRCISDKVCSICTRRINRLKKMNCQLLSDIQSLRDRHLNEKTAIVESFKALPPAPSIKKITQLTLHNKTEKEMKKKNV